VDFAEAPWWLLQKMWVNPGLLHNRIL